MKRFFSWLNWNTFRIGWSRYMLWVNTESKQSGDLIREEYWVNKKTKENQVVKFYQL